MHGGDQAYTDVYLVRTEIGPLMAELSRQAHTLVASLHQQIDSQSAAWPTRRLRRVDWYGSCCSAGWRSRFWFG